MISPKLGNTIIAAMPIAATTTHQQQQQQQPSPPPMTNKRNSNSGNSSDTSISSASSTNSNSSSRKRPIHTGTQTESYTPPTKARIVDSPSAEASDIVHDGQACMFNMKLDERGSIAALCYLPTRVQTLIEFYHTEIPLGYRDMGVGDLLVKSAFEWAAERNALVIATCPFVRRYLARHQHSNVVSTEQEAVERLM
ncbi:GCN5-related N-acetyl-transferase-domain-containing protein, partial [Zychaea mexicana]|uniref:GCN5-related N-acetyl-transferase-domain-containing protein n=1 Tax=Zychaea mexicana TaxID=64656 RepID=UPI0022FF4026